MEPGKDGRGEARRIYVVQAAAVLVMVTLLNIGFHWQREVRDLDVRENVQRLVHVWDGSEWYVWVAAAPAMLWLIRTNRLTDRAWRRSLLRLLTGSAVLYLAVTNIRFVLRMFAFRNGHLLPLGVTWTRYVHTQSVLLPLDFLTYSGFFAASYAIDSYFKHRQRTEEIRALQLRAARLQSELDRAQLAALRGHLQPHFLFNVFNAVAVLMRQGDAQAAVEMITRLGDLLRVAIEHVAEPELPLEREFEFAARYLEIERLRFSDKLSTEVDLRPGAELGLVPNLLLQPLVEYAVRNGVSRWVTPGRVSLTAERHEDRLAVRLQGRAEDSQAVATEIPFGAGPEVELARGRLSTCYGADYRFEIRGEPQATDILLEVPWRTRSPAAP